MFGYRRELSSSPGWGRKSARAGREGTLPRASGGRKAPGAGAIRSRPATVRKKLLPDLDWGRIRLWLIASLFALIWGGLWCRAYYLQIVKGPEYADKARKQHMTREVVQGTRGNITDRNGNVLAMSLECDSVWANPSHLRDKEETAAKLAEALGMKSEKILQIISADRQFVWIKRKADFQSAEKVRALKLPGVYTDTESERVYPYKHVAGQLLGYVNIDDKGIEGLEKSLENDLAGRTIHRVVERDASGRRLMPPGSGTFVDLRGKDVRLSIDTNIQFFAEESLAENVEKFGARWGGCIVVDVPSGEILAWAQYPFFDPNNIAATPAPDRRNRLAVDMLEHGSTMKSFLIAAALEEKVVQRSTIINCEKGLWKLGQFTLHDTHPYANLSVDKILHVSSNIGAAKIGLKLGADKYHSYLKRLGFGERTGLPLSGEARGILRAANRWAPIDLATASFGQSFSATLLQMSQAYLTLAGGGVKKPLRLLLETGASQDSPPRDAIFSPSTMNELRGMLREVVEEEGGTGKQARISGLVVGGKTGTAQKADASGKYGKGRVGSFVGMIPIENPRYLICTLLDEPSKSQYGGVVAAPVFRHVALRAMAYGGLLPDNDDPVVQEMVRKEAERRQKAQARSGAKNRPGTTARNPEQAGIRKADKAAPLAKAGQIGADFVPKADKAAPLAKAGQIGVDFVPKVVGMGLRGAVEVFAGRGIVPMIKGKGGFVVRQAPEAGSPWPDADKNCIIWLEEKSS
ncbi:MAG: penicillin-binding protein [Desulfovibrio sp.]|nr:penicillin-binding protein [Desulfovibrio sp.]